MTETDFLHPVTRASLVAQSLLRQDDAHASQRQAHAAEAMTTAELHDFDRDERRSWAVAQMYRDRPAQRLGGALRDVVHVDPDGTVHVVKLHGPAVVVRDWDGGDDALAERQRARVNAELARFYGPDRLGDILSPEELAHPAVQAALAEPRPPRGPAAVVEAARRRGADLERTVG